MSRFFRFALLVALLVSTAFAAQIKVPSLRIFGDDSLLYAVGNMQAVKGSEPLFNPVNATQIICFGVVCIDTYSYIDENELFAVMEFYEIKSWANGELIAVNDNAECVTQTIKISQSKNSALHIRERKSKKGICAIIQHDVLTSVLK